MRSPTAALFWEIWWPHRWTVAMVAGATAAGRILHALEEPGGDSSPLVTLLAMLAFLLLFSVFNYTETDDGRELGRFPRRLFTLPVTSLRLVAVPALGGIMAIELLYLLWLQPLSEGGAASVPFVAVLIAAFVVFYQSATWTLERAGSLRLVILGAIAIAVFGLGVLPSFPPSPPPLWRSEIVIAASVSSLAIAAFLLAWHHVAGLRTGGHARTARQGLLFGWLAEIAPARQKAFASAAAAHFWFEWRSSGMVLPALVSGLLVLIVVPMSWVARGNGGDTFRLVLATLAAPIVLAFPVGIAFSKPVFWSEDLDVPAFIATRPLSSDDLVAIKVKVAAVSTALAWSIVLVFLSVWLSMWGNLEVLSLLALQIWAFHEHSRMAVFGVAFLVPIAGMFFTWRFLISRLWSGLAGIRRLYVGSALFAVIVAIGGLAFDAHELPGWLLGDPAHIGPVVWIAAVAVVAKYWLAAHAWRRAPAHYRRAYVLIWLAGTAVLLTLGIVVWGMVRIYVPLDTERVRSFVILLALLAVPLARVGVAPSWLARNRHR